MSHVMTLDEAEAYVRDCLAGMTGWKFVRCTDVVGYAPHPATGDDESWSPQAVLAVREGGAEEPFLFSELEFPDREAARAVAAHLHDAFATPY